MKMTPSFLVVGAQKSGTTALFRYMSKHPDVFLPLQKEIGFFSSEDLFENGFQWYVDTYFSSAGDEKAAGEVSPQYMCYQKVPERIADVMPDAKLIAILRNPIDRAYSHYRMAVRKGVEDRGFSEAIRETFLRGVVRDSLIDTKVEYYQFSLYGKTLEEYLKRFPLRNIKICFQEELDTDPEKVLAEVFEFIGVDSSFVPDNLGVRYHVGGVKRYPRLEAWALSSNSIKSVVRPFLPLRLRQAASFWLQQYNVKPTPFVGLSADDREILRGIFSEDVAFLEEAFSLRAPWEDFNRVTYADK